MNMKGETSSGDKIVFPLKRGYPHVFVDNYSSTPIMTFKQGKCQLPKIMPKALIKGLFSQQ